jgi:hypothetical protein
MSALLEEPKQKSQQRFGNTNRKGKGTLEAQVASWYQEPKLQTVLTEELAKEIAECFLDGCTDEETGILCDVHPETIRKWRSFAAIRKFELNRKVFYVHEIRDGKRRDWTRLAWWLERRYPLEFSRPEVAHEISTSIHHTVNTQQNLIISSELAEQLQHRGEAVSKKIEELFNAYRPSSPDIKGVMTGENSPGTVQGADLTNAKKVKEIASDITYNQRVMSNVSDDASSLEGDQSLILEGAPPGTPRVAAGPPTDVLSPTSSQKTGTPPQKTESLDPEAVRKAADAELRAAGSRPRGRPPGSKNQPKDLIRAPKQKTEPLELEGRVRKVPVNLEITQDEKLKKRDAIMQKIMEKRKNAKVSSAEHLKAKAKMVRKYGRA